MDEKSDPKPSQEKLACKAETSRFTNVGHYRGRLIRCVNRIMFDKCDKYRERVLVTTNVLRVLSHYGHWYHLFSSDCPLGAKDVSLLCSMYIRES